MTDLDEDAVVVSIDGIGAYVFVSRQSMLNGFVARKNGDKLLPFMRSFSGAPSTYLWERNPPGRRRRTAGSIDAPVVQRALVAAQARLRESEQARSQLGCAQDLGRRVVEAREDPSPPREDEDVESERHTHLQVWQNSH